MQRRPPRGNYLLESAVVTLGVAFFVVGASDVSRILHARSAVRAGVREGLRCLYPTDAGCAAQSGDNSAPSLARYNVSVWDETAQYVVPTEIWRAEASWATEPQLVVPRESTSVSEATVQLARDRFRENDVLFPVQGHHPYLVQERGFPLIGGVDPLNPEFRNRATHGRVVPNKVVDISSLRGTTRVTSTAAQSGFEPQFRIGTAQFAVRDAWPARATALPQLRAIEQQHGVQVSCYSGELVKGASPVRIDWGRYSTLPPLCRYRNDARLFSAEGLRVPIMLRVSGSTRGTSKLGQGKALIKLRWSLGSEQAEQRLGGRLISAGASGNFVVRGAVLDDVALNARAPYEKGGAYYEELRDNGTIMLVPAAAQLYLDVFLVSRNGEPVSWQGGTLELFYPSFSFNAERFSCELSANPAECLGAVPVRPLYSSLELERPWGSRERPSTACLREPPSAQTYAREPVAYLEELRNRVIGGETAKSATFWALEQSDSSPCAPTTKSVACKAVPRAHLKGCGECEDLNERKLPEGCEEPIFDPKRDRVTGRSCRTVPLEGDDRRLACSGEPLPACARQHAVKGETFLLSADAAGCSLAALHEAAPVESEPMPVSRCASPPPLEERLRRENSVPAEVQVSLSRRSSAETLLAEPPQDECVDYRQELRRTPERLCGSMLSSEGASQCCAQSAGRCILRSVQARLPGNFSGTEGLQLAGAIERAARAVEAAYPQATLRDSCDGDEGHCLSVSAAELSEQGQANVRAALSVPVTLGALFGGERLTVEHQEGRRLERALLLE